MKTIIGYLSIYAFLISALSMHQALASDPCVCNNVTTPLLVDMCCCGCARIKTAFETYTKECPMEKLTDLDKQFDKHCKKVENTEDCEYFKKLDGKVTDLYKRCKDDLDSMHDDCEECKDCTIQK
jgi:hypothetical protein